VTTNVMKALVFKNVSEIRLQEVPIPEVSRGDDVLIKVAMCGVCGTDLKILEGKHVYKEDTILGHEFCGTVIQTGADVRTLKSGDRVAVENTLNCGVCGFCRAGLEYACIDLAQNSLGVARNGGWAQYCLAPERVCFPIPPEIDDLLGTQVETLSPVLNGLRLIQLHPWDYVVVMGFGPIGYLLATLARNMAAKVTVTEIDPFRIGVARKMGFTVLNPRAEDIEQRHIELTGGPKADVVIEAVGTELGSALRLLAPGGRLLHMGMDSAARACVEPNEITRGAVRIVGSYLGHGAMLHSIRVLKEKRIDFGQFFTDKIPLERGLEAFPRLGLDLQTMEHMPKSAMKILLTM
jgi:threonine dehydrogenase-like Zn-dependent dehydrogenase